MARIGNLSVTIANLVFFFGEVVATVVVVETRIKLQDKHTGIKPIVQNLVFSES